MNQPEASILDVVVWALATPPPFFFGLFAVRPYPGKFPSQQLCQSQNMKKESISFLSPFFLLFRLPPTQRPSPSPSTTHTHPNTSAYHTTTNVGKKMEETQSFRLAGTTEIMKIPIRQVDGQNIVCWESIKRAYPEVKCIKNGDSE